MSNHKKGSLRDSAIVEAVERHRCLDAEQIELLFFQGLRYGKQMAQRRLKRLVELKRLKRGRHSFDQPYHYFIQRPGQVEHVLAVNWAYVWITQRLKKWEQWHCFQPEVDFKMLRTDALAAVKNTVKGDMRIYFVEADLSNNFFDKVEKYNRLYASEKYAGSWWVPLVRRFPAILIFTTTEARRSAIRKEIEKHNAAGLEFRVYLLPHTREVCINGPGNSARLVSV